eukprot:NODE_3399_length_2044_cov_7.410016.p1 GENE.NODE_3399_length_2044_cov_7.410016~~NODE_3399_length_2044_cov_7.410016.p1  ORF type:complete len:534 (+),score=85.26 NODE_3399_length_2044_cov_7.410016:138-1739(+)
MSSRLLGDAAPQFENLPVWKTHQDGLVMTWHGRVLRRMVAQEDLLPDWATAEDAKREASRHVDRDTQQIPALPPLENFAGPAIKWAVWGCVNYFVFFFASPIIAFLYTDCKGLSGHHHVGFAHHHVGFAAVDDGVLTLLMLCFLIVHAVLMTKCMRYTLLPQLDRADFKLFGIPFRNYTYALYYVVMIIISSFPFLDAMMNAEVVARSVATKYSPNCTSYAVINEEWNVTMRQGIIAKLLGIKTFDWANEVVWAYVLMLSQPLFAVLVCCPSGRAASFLASHLPARVMLYRRVSRYFDTASTRPQGYGVGAVAGSPYATSYDRYTHHGAVLVNIAEIAHFDGVTFADRNYTDKMMTEAIELHGHAWQSKYVDLAEVQIQRALARFILVGFVQNALQINVQMSLVAITKAAIDITDTSTLFSVCTSALCALGDIPDMVNVIVFGRHLLAISRHPDFMNSFEGNAREKSIVTTTNHSICRKLFIFTIFVLLYIASMTYSVAKFIAFFYCDSHLLGIGCVIFNKHDTTQNASSSTV